MHAVCHCFVEGRELFVCCAHDPYSEWVKSKCIHKRLSYVNLHFGALLMIARIKIFNGCFRLNFGRADPVVFPKWERFTPVRIRSLRFASRECEFGAFQKMDGRIAKLAAILSRLFATNCLHLAP
jgi:hypothetical protein